MAKMKMMKMKKREKKIIKKDTILGREKQRFTTSLHWKVNLVTRESPTCFIVAQLLLQDQDSACLLRDQEVPIVNE